MIMNGKECVYCHNDQIAKNGILKYGGQRYRCRTCNKSFTLGGKRGTYSDEYKIKITLEYCHKHISSRKIIDKYHISTATLVNWAKEHKQNCQSCK